jgi:hypothetical protein
MLAGVLSAALYFTLLGDPSIAGPYEKFFESFTEIVGVLIAGTAAGLIGFGGRISKFALGFRPLVRVGLDVDNWLREHPLASNPTARICGRHVSLLRHILAWRDTTSPEDRYTAIVIVAHSQGTVITSDLLRFLTLECKRGNRDHELDRLRSGKVPVYLFTMGRPLRQLYGLRFPFLYGRARDRKGPDPASLGVQEWINAYRSGDYVGRYLWPAGEDRLAWDAIVWKLGDAWPPNPNVNQIPRQGKGMELRCAASGTSRCVFDGFDRLLLFEVRKSLIQSRLFLWVTSWVQWAIANASL